jgi:hypothetical protein
MKSPGTRTRPHRVTAVAILAGCLALPGVRALAQVGLDKVAQTTMNFQLVSVSARASALGEAVTAVSTGSEAIFYNPAGTAETRSRFDVSLMYTGWIAEINYFAGALAWDVGDAGTFGFSMLGVDYGTLNGTRLVSSGSLNTTYEETGEMAHVGAYSVGLTYARAISEQFFVGINLRYAVQNLGESTTKSGPTLNSAGKVAADLGVTYYPGLRSFRFAMAFRNFAGQLKREEVYEQLPLTFAIGAAIDLMDFIEPAHGSETGLTLSADFLHSNNYSQRLNFGLEYLMFGVLALRGGYQTNRDIASWSAGLGVTTSLEDVELGVSYSFSRFEYFDGVNRFSLQILF